MSKEIRRRMISIIIGFLISWAVLGLALLLNLPEMNLILLIVLGNSLVFLGYAGGLACVPAIIAYNDFITRDQPHTYRTLVVLIIVAVAIVSMILSIGHLAEKQRKTVQQLQKTMAELESRNKLLAQLSRTDTLTHIYNRAALRDNFEKMLNKDAAIIFIDIDNFKQFNDHYSHETGDFVISSVASEMALQFGRDSCYRYGGDEFLVLLDHVNNAHIQRKLRAMQESLHCISYHSLDLSVSLTAGYAYGKVSTNDGLRDMLHQADLNLYYAKARKKGIIIGSEYIDVTQL